ncbi:prolactin-releasing peptide receptor-like [Onthophagus taurus]|uniref:prolactin-releasing peptide receptor-like n=1 Tax=Onthophagus taurus TaxID=166361 RepID=UPI000C20FC4E|nr:prolactin-releasing peptide receptor-like isoform X2 [Onthophagus taurus]
MIINNDDDSSKNDLINNIWIQIVFYFLYAVIFFLGLFGNLLVCYIVYSNKAMQTVTNLFITNLALSDILLCAFAVPFTPLYTFIGKWVFGKVICHLLAYAQATSVYVSTLTLTVIAIDRFFVILHPLRQRMKLSTCFTILLGIWIFSMLVTLPYGICMQVKIHDGREVCEEDWSLEYIEKAFGFSTLVMQFIIPFIIITYCYMRISKRLNQRAKSKPGTKSARREEADREKKKRTNRMLIAMVTIFGICWFPLNIVNFVNDLYHELFGDFFHLFFFLAHSMAVSSTCYNPFLYAWLNENFRKEFKQVLPCILRNTASRYCNGDEHTLDTLLHSTVITSPVKHLEPREPIAERIPQTQEYNL